MGRSLKVGFSLPDLPAADQSEGRAGGCRRKMSHLVLCTVCPWSRELPVKAGSILGTLKDEWKPAACLVEQLPTRRLGLVPAPLIRKETRKINSLKVMKCSHILIMRLYKYHR